MLCPTKDELPLPPVGRKGWPWTEEMPTAAAQPPSGGSWPKITVVTPSFNQGRFIEETIRSVLLQSYPNLEYFVIDGGSSDETVGILKKYEPWLSYWVSEKDQGQAHAINKGFARAAGDWIAWQNSDDFYYPGALHAVGCAAMRNADADVVYGDKDYVDQAGGFLFTARAKDPHELGNMIPWPCVNSEVTLFRRRLFAAEGFRVNEQRRHYMDYELFLDLLFAGKRFVHAPGVRAGFRQHPAAKSSSQADVAQKEEFEIHRRIYRQPGVSPAVRGKAFEALLNDCRNDFGHFRLRLLRAHVGELRQMVGSSHSLPQDLVWRYLASFAGEPLLRLIKDGFGIFRSHRQPTEHEK